MVMNEGLAIEVKDLHVSYFSFERSSAFSWGKNREIVALRGINLNIDPGQSVAILGKNGAGKTTLFESVMLCLYGQDSFEEKKSKKEYQEIIGRSIHRYLGTKKSAEEASVIIEFQFAHEGKIEEFQP